MEGPSIHLLAEELQPFVKLKIKAASGNAHFDKEPLLHQRINAIYAFGKRLIIELDTYALTTHFLMYGSYRVDTQRSGMMPRLALITSKHSLYFYNCSIKCVPLSEVQNLPLERDILSPHWDIKKIVKMMQKHPKDTIDDILLDQDIFPGVGNIIKNEALFLSKTSPSQTIKKLSKKKLENIAMQTRLFSEKFLVLRRKFELKKNLEIYRKKECPVCGSKIIRAKTGKKQRWSFVCPQCQK